MKRQSLMCSFVLAALVASVPTQVQAIEWKSVGYGMVIGIYAWHNKAISEKMQETVKKWGSKIPFSEECATGAGKLGKNLEKVLYGQA